MIIRIVKMTFLPENTDTFRKIFESAKDQIAAFDGCNSVKLFQDTFHSNIFFTYSIWTDAAALENYRNSNLFKETWSKTKPLFIQKAEAWSVKEI